MEHASAIDEEEVEDEVVAALGLKEVNPHDAMNHQTNDDDSYLQVAPLMEFRKDVRLPSLPAEWRMEQLYDIELREVLHWCENNA